MKKQIVFLVVGVVVFVVGVVAHSFVSAAGGCQKPSESEVFCYENKNETKDCSGRPGEDCVGRSQYVINKFPDGATSADTGTTTEEKVDCYQETRCRHNADNKDRCEVAGTLQYETGDKTVTGTGTCPTE